MPQVEHLVNAAAMPFVQVNRSTIGAQDQFSTPEHSSLRRSTKLIWIVNRLQKLLVLFTQYAKLLSFYRKRRSSTDHAINKGSYEQSKRMNKCLNDNK